MSQAKVVPSLLMSRGPPKSGFAEEECSVLREVFLTPRAYVFLVGPEVFRVARVLGVVEVKVVCVVASCFFGTFHQVSRVVPLSTYRFTDLVSFTKTCGRFFAE